MGGAKRLMEENDNKESEAIHIAVEAGVLQECEVHDGTYFLDSGDLEEAENLASEMFEKGEVKSFSDKTELLKTIASVVQEHGAEECFSCDFN